jgi:hypothetical protein
MAQKDWCYIKVSPHLKAKIDREDFEKVSGHSWRAKKSVSGRYKVVTSYRVGGKVQHVGLGKFLMKPPKGKQVYPRRFNDGLDYRKSNLIVCTRHEMQRLLPKRRKKTTSIYRGVSLVSRNEKWRAGIEVKGHYKRLGDFKTEAEAALAYNEAARKYFGDHAYQNQINRPKGKRQND